MANLIAWLRKSRRPQTVGLDLTKASDADLLTLHQRCHAEVKADWVVLEGKIGLVKSDQCHDDHALIFAEMRKRGLLHLGAGPAKDPVEKASGQEVTAMIQVALEAQFGRDKYPYVVALESIPATGACVVCVGSDYYRVQYDCSGDAAILTDLQEVEQEWVGKAEGEAEGDSLSLPFVIRKADERGNIYGLAAIADDEAIAKWAGEGGDKEQAPAVVDTQGDWMSEATLTEMAEGYLAKGDPTIGLQHQKKIARAQLLQSAVITRGTCWPEADSPPLEVAKAWAFAVHVEDEEVKKAAKEGKLTGLSIGGRGERVEA